jgi:filamentous hemagglutinin
MRTAEVSPANWRRSWRVRVAANILAGGIGVLIGGNSGAFSAANTDLYNRNGSNGDGKGGTGSEFRTSAGNAVSGAWNGLVGIAETFVNIPNGGPFATPGDPGYISLGAARLSYTPGDQIGSNVELIAAILATRKVGKGSVAESEAQALTEAQAFEKSLVGLPPGERVAQVKQTAQSVAVDNGWQKDSQLSRLNDRDVYRAADGTLYAVDSQHGRFEVVNGKTGAHMGEVTMKDLVPTKSADASGRHDLRLK